MPVTSSYIDSVDYLIFIVVILALVFILVLLNRSQKKDKEKYRRQALRLLDESYPSEKELKDTLRHLKLYAGRLKKDPELYQLMERLMEKLDSAPKSA
jgi:hypothetical protein